MFRRPASHVERLLERLRDRRSQRVIFLSHCLLNENTRYLGGACRPGAVREIVEACMDAGYGIVQLPCPEQAAWGGVLKRRLLVAYGLRCRAPWVHALRGPLLALGLLYTRWAYRRLAERIAAEVADYVASGFAVVGVVGVDGSPSCGVTASVDVGRCAPLLAIPADELTVERENEILRRANRPGPGLFTAALRRALERRRLDVRLTAHDLFAELDAVPPERAGSRAAIATSQSTTSTR